MTVSTAFYTIPEIQILRIDSFDVAPEYKPELIKLDHGSGKSPRYLRPYRVCYLDRRSIDPSITSAVERDKVNQLSLCVTRVALIKPIIKAVLEGHPGVPAFIQIECALDWIDQQCRSAEMHTPEGVRKLYQDYTNHIRHRLHLSSVGDSNQSIGFASAQRLQAGMAYLCGLACELDISVVQSWAFRVPQKVPRVNELPAPATTAKEHKLAYALHKRFFYAFSGAVLNNSPPPVVVELADLGFEDLIYYNQHANNAGGKWSKSDMQKGRDDWKPFFTDAKGCLKVN